MNIEELTKQTTNNLKELAKELSRNQFDNASIDIFKKQYRTDSEYLLENGELQFLLSRVLKNSGGDETDRNYFEEAEKHYNYNPKRNILILGAGATASSFESIPLANEAIIKIQNNIIVVHGTKEIPEINFDYFIKFYQKHKGYNRLNIPNSSELNEQDSKYRFLKKVFEGKNPLDQSHKSLNYLDSLGKNYFNEYKKLKLYSDDKSNEGRIDFETSLNIFSNLFDISTVRDLIRNLYDYRHGPTISYQIIAHLFKNRFIDVIVNFNFDEFLDQAIRDELDESCYDYVVSDGDCRELDYLDTYGKIRQPLYIKPHGTANHKSSLRFTKNHYHDLPVDMRKLLEALFSGKAPLNSGYKDKVINLITIGFEMESLELNEILSSKLPKYSKVFSWYYHAEKAKEKDIIEKRDNRVLKLDKLFNCINNKGKIEKVERIIIKPIGHEFFREPINGFLGKIDKCFSPLDNAIIKLYELIKNKFNEPFKPSNIDHHLIIGKIFGSRDFIQFLKPYNCSSNHKDNHNKPEYPYPDLYFNSSKYYKDRFIIETIIHAGKNNGFLEIPVMMKGIIGYYYNLYFSTSKENERKPIIKVLKEVFNSKDDEELKPFNINYPRQGETIKQRIENALESGFFSLEMKNYLSKLISNEAFDNYLFDHFIRIINSNSSKIQSKLRSSVHHTFESYGTTDLVSTNLHLDMLFYLDVIKDNSEFNELIITADYAHQVTKFSSLIKERIKKGKLKRISFLLQWSKYDESAIKNKIIYKNEENKALERLFNISQEEDKEQFQQIAHVCFINFLPAKLHNHHMRISKHIIDDKVKPKAIYYYKRGLSVNINPIRIEIHKNVKYLLEVFKEYSKKSDDLRR